jgi:hypothetical protein
VEKLRLKNMDLLTMSESQLKKAELIVSILGFGAVLITLLFGFIQYRRAERWKRGEFIANAIKEFESNPTVRVALLLIDYGRRRINIFQIDSLSDQEGVRITRGIQWRALLPDTLKKDFEEYRDPSLRASTATSSGKLSAAEKEEMDDVFTPLEARIRDAYDAFLDYLERLASLVELRLVKAEDFKPYLSYWVDAITNNKHPEIDSTWRITLLTYINFYGYPAVRRLFAAYGRDINPEGMLYQQLIEELKRVPSEKTRINRTLLAERLYSSI